MLSNSTEMDKVIKQKKWPLKKVILLLCIPLLIFFLIAFAINSRESSFKVNKSKLSYGKAQYGAFQDMISLQGTVEPIHTIQLDASEGGIVEEIYVDDGAMVTENQALIKLSNTTLKLDFMNRETQIVEQINNLRSTRITLDQNKRQVQEQLVDLTYNLKEQKRQYKLDSLLFLDSVISTTDYLASEALYAYQKEKEKLLNERLNTDEAYRQSQLARIDASVDMMERNLEAIRKNLENLIVRAPISGQLNSFDHEIGQTKNKGQSLGRIDRLEGFLLSAQVDQYYLNRMKVGQNAKASFANKKFNTKVHKIFPTVVNSQFEVHLLFTDSILPANIRRGQNVQIRLELNAVKEALLLPRGSFSQSNGGQYVYVVDGDAAYKRKVKLGSQNPEFIEVLEGLTAEEKIITSSYQAFGDAEKIVLTQ